MSQVTEQDLFEATGYERRADLMRCLREQRIPFYLGKGGCIWTTQQALDAGLVGSQTEQPAKQGFG